jgi:hypothetical protein
MVEGGRYRHDNGGGKADFRYDDAKVFVDLK